VSWESYPDPTNHGWSFTGSWEPSLVEFFEHRLVLGGGGGDHDDDNAAVVKLDWYYTTATMKTSLHHPRQGKTQMFANRVTPQLYLDILQNPRAHTNQRYQQRRKNGGGNGNRFGKPKQRNNCSK
jgi:hypothetical protein